MVKTIIKVTPGAIIVPANFAGKFVPTSDDLTDAIRVLGPSTEHAATTQFSFVFGREPSGKELDACVHALYDSSRDPFTFHGGDEFSHLFSQSGRYDLEKVGLLRGRLNNLGRRVYSQCVYDACSR